MRSGTPLGPEVRVRGAGLAVNCGGFSSVSAAAGARKVAAVWSWKGSGTVQARRSTSPCRNLGRVSPTALARNICAWCSASSASSRSSALSTWVGRLRPRVISCGVWGMVNLNTARQKTIQIHNTNGFKMFAS